MTALRDNPEQVVQLLETHSLWLEQIVAAVLVGEWDTVETLSKDLAQGQHAFHARVHRENLDLTRR